MTAIAPEAVDTTVLDDLDFDHQLRCEVHECAEADEPSPAVAVLTDTFGCCTRRRPICEHHRLLVVALMALHIPLRCKHHDSVRCAHLAFAIGPLP